MNWYKKSQTKEPWEMTAEEFSVTDYGILPGSESRPTVIRIKNLLESNGIPVEEIGIKGSHRFGVADRTSDFDVYVKIPNKDFQRADDLVSPLSKEGIDVFINWTGVGLPGGQIRGEKTHQRLIERAIKEGKPVPKNVLDEYLESKEQRRIFEDSLRKNWKNRKH